MEPTYLTPAEMVERCRGTISLKTLRNWRHLGQGPAFVRFGGKVLYPIADVLKWEASRRQTKASERAGKAA